MFAIRVLRLSPPILLLPLLVLLLLPNCNGAVMHPLNIASLKSSSLYRVACGRVYAPDALMTRNLSHSDNMYANGSIAELDASQSLGFAVPAFMIVGAWKSATTLLWRLLCAHPEVACMEQKEPHYFKTVLKLYEMRFIKYYVCTLCRKDELAAQGYARAMNDASVAYLVRGPVVAPLLKRRFPWLRIVILLRDPIAAALSMWNQHRTEAAAGKPNVSLSDWQRLDYAHYARYDQFLPSWLQTFGKANVLVAQAEEMRHNASALYERVLRFLHLRPHEIDDVQLARLSNAKSYAQFYTHEQYEWMVQQMRPVAARVTEQLGGVDFGWQRIWAHVLDTCGKGGNGNGNAKGTLLPETQLQQEEDEEERAHSLWEGDVRPEGCDPSAFPMTLFPDAHFPPTASAATPCPVVRVEDPWHDNFGSCSVKDY